MIFERKNSYNYRPGDVVRYTHGRTEGLAHFILEENSLRLANLVRARQYPLEFQKGAKPLLKFLPNYSICMV